MYYALRITTDLEFTEFSHIINSTSIFGCKEHATNQHYHFVFISEENRTTISRHIGKLFPGNAGHSLSVVKDLDKSLRYVSKDNDIVINTMNCDVEDLHKRYWETNSEIKKNSKSQFEEILDLFEVPPKDSYEVYRVVWSYLYQRTRTQKKEFCKFRYSKLSLSCIVYFFGKERATINSDNQIDVLNKDLYDINL